MNRSYLYLPLDRIDRLNKAADSGAHGVILDLEDGVSPDKKAQARQTLAELGPELTALRQHHAGLTFHVRFVPETARDDLQAAQSCGVDGLIVPKATISLLASLDTIRAETGVEALPITALIESAQGILDAPLLARASGVVRLALGEADLGADLGVTPGADGAEFAYARGSVVVASAAGGLAAPTAPVWTAISDPDGFRASCEQLKRMGFGSRSAIHPSQVEIINDVFSPTATEIQRAREVIASFDQLLELGHGVATDTDGNMVDEAVVRRSRALLEELDD